MPAPASPLDQSTYQVRFEWGADGLRRLAAADVVVFVDVLAPAASGARGAGGGDRGVGARGADATAALLEAVPPRSAVVRGGLRDRRAVAEWVLARQAEKGDRFSVAVVAAGETHEGALRLAVEDLLAAGAIVDALADLGIDHSSPEAAAAGAAFAGLRNAVRHLVRASGSGRVLLAAGREEELDAAVELDADAEAHVVRESRLDA